MPKPRSSPWGAVQTCREIAPGFYSVSTASHGGLMLDVAFVVREGLSLSAVENGFMHDDYLCYEEDCDWAVPLWELRSYWPAFFKDASAEYKSNPEPLLRRTLSAWSADYLRERGDEVDPEAATRFDERATEDAMRAAKHPDLIVAARGDWHTGRPGVVEVQTADDKYHLVTAASYEPRNGINLLSKCEVVE